MATVKDRYPRLRDLLVSEYGSVNKFLCVSKLARSSVVQTIQGKFGKNGCSDIRQRERIESFLKNDRPGLDLSGIWDEVNRRRLILQKRDVIGGRTVLITIEELED